MNNPLTEKIRNRKAIINVGINAEIKKYQQKLVQLSFSKGNVTEEYNSIVEKIKILRLGLLEGKLPNK